jgi:hypothetical protein
MPAKGINPGEVSDKEVAFIGFRIGRFGGRAAAAVRSFGFEFRESGQ